MALTFVRCTIIKTFIKFIFSFVNIILGVKSKKTNFAVHDELEIDQILIFNTQDLHRTVYTIRKIKLI